MAGDKKEEKKYSRRDFVIGGGTAIECSILQS
jgi:hypothetical protein